MDKLKIILFYSFISYKMLKNASQFGKIKKYRLKFQNLRHKSLK